MTLLPISKLCPICSKPLEGRGVVHTICLARDQVGLSPLGKPFDEATLLRAAYTYELSGAATLGDPPLC